MKGRIRQGHGLRFVTISQVGWIKPLTTRLTYQTLGDLRARKYVPVRGGGVAFCRVLAVFDHIESPRGGFPIASNCVIPELL